MTDLMDKTNLVKGDRKDAESSTVKKAEDGEKLANGVNSCSGDSNKAGAAALEEKLIKMSVEDDGKNAKTEQPAV